MFRWRSLKLMDFQEFCAIYTGQWILGQDPRLIAVAVPELHVYIHFVIV